MAPSVDQELIEKISAVMHGPSSELLREFVDFLYYREIGTDAEPLDAEELAMIKESKEQIQRGETRDWEDFKRRRGL